MVASHVCLAAPTPPARRTALAAALMLAAFGVAALAYAPVALPAVPAFVPAQGTAVMLADLAAAYLLFVHFRASGRLSLLPLAAGFAYAGLIALPWALATTGELGGDGASAAAASWRLWHGGFPALLIVYGLAEWRVRRGVPRAGRPAWAAAAVGAATVLAGGATAFGWLAADAIPATGSAVSVGLWLLNLGALAVVAGTGRSRSGLQLWLCVALLAGLLDVTLDLASGARFTIGWYMARLEGLAAAGTVLGVLLRDTAGLVAEVSLLTERLGSLVATDGLTQLANRRSFDQQLHAEFLRARREHSELALLLIDVDQFRRFNEAYGHAAGDECLRLLAAALRPVVRRPGDLVARFDGEEFAILLPRTGLTGALLIAETARRAVAGLAIRLSPDLSTETVTVSVGAAAAAPLEEVDERGLLAAASAALQRAKASGNDSVLGETADAPAETWTARPGAPIWAVELDASPLV